MLKNSRTLPLTLASLLSAGALLAAVTARSAPPDPPAASPSEAPQSTAVEAPLSSASGSASAAPLPRVRGEDIPSTATEMPGDNDWGSAKKVRFAREDEVPCEMVVLRDWARISCDVFGVTLFAGDPTDVKLVPSKFPLGGGGWGAPPPSLDGSEKAKILLRLRRGGEPVMFQLHNGSSGYGGAVMGNAALLSVAWREGQPDPVILVSKPGE